MAVEAEVGLLPVDFVVCVTEMSLVTPLQSQTVSTVAFFNALCPRNLHTLQAVTVQSEKPP